MALHKNDGTCQPHGKTSLALKPLNSGSRQGWANAVLQADAMVGPTQEHWYQ